MDYSRVFHEVRQVVEQSSFNLIETLAEEISLRILKRFPAHGCRNHRINHRLQSKEFDYVAAQIYRCREDMV